MTGEEQAAALLAGALVTSAAELGFSIAEWCEIQAMRGRLRFLCEQAAARELQARRLPLAERAVTSAAAADQAAAALAPGGLELAALRQRIAEVSRRRAGLVTVGGSVDDEVEADMRSAALGRQYERIESEIRQREREQSPLVAAAGQAARVAELALAALGSMDAAIADPLACRDGMATVAGNFWLANGEWLSHLDLKGFYGKQVRGLIFEVLRRTGIGAEIEENMRAGAARQKAVAGGTEIANGLAFSTAAGTFDASKVPPDPVAQYSQASASTELAAMHGSSGFVSSGGGVPVLGIAPMGAPRDLSGDGSVIGG